jgi:hypothetical protein|tara:strand:+ start:3296 stop:4117 length:822 start_codon:yes stop_codon:yes gene_type:complete
MKTKHNKKRNTAFLFESLVRELTKSIVSSNPTQTQKIKDIIKEHFHKGSVLFTELDCFRSLTETCELDMYTAEKLIFHAKSTHQKLNTQKIFTEQSRLIKTINAELTSDIYSNFVPNYRSFATIAQVFNRKTPIKQRVLMEKHILHGMTSPGVSGPQMQPVDGLVLKSFTDNYNQKYETLLPEQKVLLNRFVTLNENTRADFSVYLLGELKRLDALVRESLEMNEVKDDEMMYESTNKVLQKLGKINISAVSEAELVNILKVQGLVREYSNDN